MPRRSHASLKRNTLLAISKGRDVVVSKQGRITDRDLKHTWLEEMEMGWCTEKDGERQREGERLPRAGLLRGQRWGRLAGLVPLREGLPAAPHGFHHSTVEFGPSLPHVRAEGSAEAFLQHVQQGLADGLQTKRGGNKLSSRVQQAAPSLALPPLRASPIAGHLRRQPAPSLAVQRSPRGSLDPARVLTHTIPLSCPALALTSPPAH